MNFESQLPLTFHPYLLGLGVRISNLFIFHEHSTNYRKWKFTAKDRIQSTFTFTPKMEKRREIFAFGSVKHLPGSFHGFNSGWRVPHSLPWRALTLLLASHWFSSTNLIHWLPLQFPSAIFLFLIIFIRLLIPYYILVFSLIPAR